MGGANPLEIETSQLLQRHLHLDAVLAHNVGVVANHLREVGLNVHLTVEYTAVQCPEASEGIAREERAALGLVSHHCFGPVHHRDEVEAQVHALQAELAPFGHAERRAALAVVAFGHLQRLLVAHQADVGVNLANQSDAPRMVGLHVINH